MCAICPLFLAPFCELVGRKVVYTASYVCFTLVFIGLALGKNIATILVMRTLLGIFGCVGTILVGGTFSDMYPENERARPMALFSYCAILGTVAAPIYAGFIDETIGWRWIEGVQGLSNIPLLILVVFFLKETRGGVTLQKRAKTLREKTNDDRYRSPLDLETESLKDMLHTSSVKALKMLVTEPVVFAFGFMIMFAWGVSLAFFLPKVKPRQKLIKFRLHSSSSASSALPLPVITTGMRALVRLPECVSFLLSSPVSLLPNLCPHPSKNII